jgi:hypothetical protein
VSAHPLKIRNLWPAICLAVASWTLPATANADSWKVTADEAGTITQLDLTEPTHGDKQRQVQITVTPALTPSQATVTVEGKSRPATERELQFFWMDRGALAAAWDHYLEAGRLKLSLMAAPPKDVAVPRENRALIPKNGKLPKALLDKIARVTLYNDITLIGTIRPGAEETEFLLRIGASNVKIAVSAVQTIYVLPE